MLRSIGWQELAIVLVIVLILFGPKRLPQLGKMFGKTMRNVREGMEGKYEEDSDTTDSKTDELTAKSESDEVGSRSASKEKTEEKAS